MTEELLAQVIEEVSVLAADYRRKEPRSIPRPYADQQTEQPMESITGSPETGVKAFGLDGMLAAAQMYGVGGDGSVG